MAMFRESKLSIKLVDPGICSKKNSICHGCKGMCRNAKKQVSQIDPGILHVVVSGLHGDEPNENGDFFEWQGELLKHRNDGIYTFQTWIGRPNCINHDEGVRVGKVIDAWPIVKEKSVDMLLGTNRGHKIAGHDLTDLVRKGSITDVSMGTYVGWSQCSVCKNIAHHEDQWCDHLKYHKGRKDPETNKHVYENNHDVCGLELSWITIGEGADRGAKTKKVLG